MAKRTYFQTWVCKMVIEKICGARYRVAVESCVVFPDAQCVCPLSAWSISPCC